MSTADPEAIYDETLNVVSKRAASAKSLAKADIGSLVLWKRISAQTKWAAKLQMVPDATVRGVTADAFRLANDESATVPDAGQAARRALRALPGMGPALASAVLLACAPHRMAVWDRRVKSGLKHPSVAQAIANKDWTYGEYLRVACSLASEMSPHLDNMTVTPRHVDLALFHLGGSKPQRSQ
ncbi:hypothetical protein ACMYYO_00990 [Dermacoccaceae bacterium W4C1]